MTENITFTGVQGVGKSYQAAKLEQQGYMVFDCQTLADLQQALLTMKALKGQQRVVVAAPADIISQIEGHPEIAKQLCDMTQVVHLEPSAALLREVASAKARPLVETSKRQGNHSARLTECFELGHQEVLRSHACYLRAAAHASVPFEVHRHPNTDIRTYVSALLC